MPKDPAQGAFWVIEIEQDKLRAQIPDLKERIAEEASALGALDQILAPVWEMEGRVKHAIGLTYDNPQIINPAGAADRKPLYERLTDIAERWGKVKTERREVQARLRAYWRDLQRIERELENQAKRAARRKAPPPPA